MDPGRLNQPTLDTLHGQAGCGREAATRAETRPHSGRVASRRTEGPVDWRQVGGIEPDLDFKSVGEPLRVTTARRGGLGRSSETREARNQHSAKRVSLAREPADSKGAPLCLTTAMRVGLARSDGPGEFALRSNPTVDVTSVVRSTAASREGDQPFGAAPGFDHCAAERAGSEPRDRHGVNAAHVERT